MTARRRAPTRGRSLPGCAAALGLLLGACEGDQVPLAPVGPQARHISELWWLYFSICTAVFALVVAALLLALLRRRAGRAGPEEGPALSPEVLPPPERRSRPLVALDTGRERRMLYVVAGATGLSVVALLVLLVTSVATGQKLTELPQENALTIEVVGQQWWWKVRYLDSDPSRVFTTANEIHLPVGRPVVFRLTSADVIHSFWVPRLHGKRDLIPGRENTLVLQADAPGVYRGQCAEFCGHGHAKMAFVVVAESPEEFERWRRHQLQPAPAPVTASQRRGLDVFLQGPCALCHAIAGTEARASVAPDLTHVASRRSIAGASLPKTRGHLAGWILNPQSLKPGNRMPNISLPPGDLHALLDYLETLK